MKNFLLCISIIAIFSCSKQPATVEIGKKVPEYTFTDILNTNQKSFSLRTQNKPVLIEFWATWCSACIPAMSKLEKIQKKYKDKLEIITVSTDSKTNLNRYIDHSNTPLRIAYDTTHKAFFNYKYIPHTVLIDKNGITQAITTPDKISNQLIEDLILGKPIHIPEDKEEIATNLQLNKTFKTIDYQYILTSENRNKGFKNEIKRNADNKPVALDFRNVSIYRLLTDIYELSSAARIYSEHDISTANKYCFKLEQHEDYKKEVLQNAKDILNEHLEYKAHWVEKELDSAHVLEIIDKHKLPKKSIEQKYYYELRGPYYLGKKVTSYNLIKYLENVVQYPVKDKALLDYAFDIELNWTYGDSKTLNKELAKYGLKISRSLKPEKVNVLELTKKNDI